MTLWSLWSQLCLKVALRKPINSHFSLELMWDGFLLLNLQTPNVASISYVSLQCQIYSLLPPIEILILSPEAAAAKLLQSCPTLCNPIDCSPPGSAVPGTLQARTLEWVAISFSNTWKWKVKMKSLSRVWLLASPWTTAYQAPPSMAFSRQEYWSGVPLPSPPEANTILINKL